MPVIGNGEKIEGVNQHLLLTHQKKITDKTCIGNGCILFKHKIVLQLLH
jgi:hypothetical protein